MRISAVDAAAASWMPRRVVERSMKTMNVSANGTDASSSTPRNVYKDSFTPSILHKQCDV